MTKEIENLFAIANKTQQLLVENNEWVERYANYASNLLSKKDAIKNKKRLFHQFSPLFLYMNVSNAIGSGIFGLRYAGQQVANLFIRDGEVKIDTKNYDNNNSRDFDCNVRLDSVMWNSIEAKQFRKHFVKAPTRNNNSKKSNHEHRIESLLLSEFSKNQAAKKRLLGIQPVKLFSGISRFQMPTPLTASRDETKYSGAKGGGIDILSRVGIGASTKLCVIEVKDETLAKEPPIRAIGQAIAYAVFLRELLRSKSGNDWYRILGFSRDVPSKLQIVASTAMPLNENIGSDFENAEIPLGGNDKLILQSIYFEESNDEIIAFTSSFLKKGLCK